MQIMRLNMIILYNEHSENGDTFLSEVCVLKMKTKAEYLIPMKVLK